MNKDHKRNKRNEQRIETRQAMEGERDLYLRRKGIVPDTILHSAKIIPVYQSDKNSKDS